MPVRDDLSRLHDMLGAAQDAIGLAAGRRRHDLDTDVGLRLALQKAIEIIGEAAAKVSPDCRRRHPPIAWADITGMRHRLTHDYFRVDLDVVWSTVRDDLPALARLLEEAVRREEDGARGP